MKYSIWSLASLAVLVFAGWQAVGTLSRMPAFNRALQVETATRGHRPRVRSSMYDNGQYLYRIATDWYYHTAALVRQASDEDPPAPDEIIAGRERTRDIVTASLRANPGDPHAWMLLAQTEAALDHPDRALTAYIRSGELAPQSNTLALKRLTFLRSFTYDMDKRALAQARVAPERVQADLETVETYAPDRYRQWFIDTPGLDGFRAEGNDPN